MHEIEEARRLVKSADAIIIAAGAGMSTDSGLPTFRGNGGFWNAYPALGQQQLSFTDVASPHTFARDPRLAWGVYGHRLKIYRDAQPHDGYRLLMGLALKADLGAFVVTTNVDGHFQRAGFPDDRVWEMHGSIHQLQCLEPCVLDLWPAWSVEPDIDASACRYRGEVPKCRACGGVARPNILMFNDWSWVSDRADSQERRFERFAERAVRPVVIEIGAGTGIPSLRNLSRRRVWPIVRINLGEAGVEEGEGVGLRAGALKGIRALVET